MSDTAPWIILAIVCFAFAFWVLRAFIRWDELETRHVENYANDNDVSTEQSRDSVSGEINCQLVCEYNNKRYALICLPQSPGCLNPNRDDCEYMIVLTDYDELQKQRNIWQRHVNDDSAYYGDFRIYTSDTSDDVVLSAVYEQKTMRVVMDKNGGVCAKHVDDATVTMTNVGDNRYVVFSWCDSYMALSESTACYGMLPMQPDVMCSVADRSVDLCSQAAVNRMRVTTTTDSRHALVFAIEPLTDADLHAREIWVAHHPKGARR